MMNKMFIIILIENLIPSVTPALEIDAEKKLLCSHTTISKMKTKIIKIGNSKGIRIPRHILEQSGLKNEVEIELKDKAIILKPVKKAREGWDEAFREMAKHKDDIWLDIESLDNLSSWA